MFDTFASSIRRQFSGMAIAACSVLFSVLFAAPAAAGEATIAVAANFIEAAEALAAAFEEETGHSARLSVGSTGQLYAQIVHGAPFDIFLAADQARPAQAVQEGYAAPESLFTYAVGKIVLYSADETRAPGPDRLAAGDFRKLAIANPATAPYGAAAIETMKALDLYDALQPKLVQGVNIAQAYQFVETQNAELGFVALSQVVAHDSEAYWVAPEDLYSVIAQDAVLLTRARVNDAAQAFFHFLQSLSARTIIERYGYSAPQ